MPSTITLKQASTIAEIRRLAIVLKGLVGGHGKGLLFHHHVTFQASGAWTLIGIALGMKLHIGVDNSMRNPDLAQPLQCGSSPSTAHTVMRPDHAKTNFVFHRYCGDLLHFIACASVARDRLFAAAAGVGVRSHFKVHFVETCPSEVLSGACETFGSRDGVACRGCSALDF